MIMENDRIAVSRYIEKEGTALYQAAEARELEGVVAKRKESLYFMVKRTKDWVKFKRMADEEFIVAGYIQKGGIPLALYWQNTGLAGWFIKGMLPPERRKMQ